MKLISNIYQSLFEDIWNATYQVTLLIQTIYPITTPLLSLENKNLIY